MNKAGLIDMSSVLGVGIATLDIIQLVERYPVEDQELRALEHRRARGGNATNTLVVLGQLDHSCAWAGVLPKEPDADFVCRDLERYGIDLSLVQRLSHGKLPVSCITLSRATGSRTIVHYRDLPEYPFRAFDRIDLSYFDWIHFEGRAVDELELMLKKTAAAGVPCSLEVEKGREGIERLFPHADVLIFSRAYASARGFDTPRAFLADALPSRKNIYLAWGEEGGWCRAADGVLHHSPAPRVEVVDSVGAGDVFNAAVIHGHLRGWGAERTLQWAVRLAAAKCQRQGFDGLGEVGDG